MAQRVVARNQAVTDADPLIEDEAFALPQALFRRHFLKIFQDPALEVIDFFHAFSLQEGGRLFAADAASAEHRHFRRGTLTQQRVAAGAKPVGKIAEAGSLRIDCPFERADSHLIVIAGVDHDCGRVGDQRVPVRRTDIGANRSERIDLGLPHGHDLFLQAHFHSVEWHGRRAREFDLEPLAAGQRANMIEQRGDPGITARDRAVDPFVRQQQRALHAIGAATGQQRALQSGMVRKWRELVKRRNADRQAGVIHRPPLNCDKAPRQWPV